GEGTIKYMRVIREGDNVEYDECIMQGKKVLDYNERLTDKTLLEEILADPRTKGCPVIVFHKKTGLPIS
ncbi:MAG TPA: hypothetical protein VK668_07180, partial [Mucilaginibacter sp.]|nr:hypothetical protein [Mucilaginibacter sp.]